MTSVVSAMPAATITSGIAGADHASRCGHGDRPRKKDARQIEASSATYAPGVSHPATPSTPLQNTVMAKPMTPPRIRASARPIHGKNRRRILTAVTSVRPPNRKNADAARIASYPNAPETMASASASQASVVSVRLIGSPMHYSARRMRSQRPLISAAYVNWNPSTCTEGNHAAVVW